ncbi:hypothetical protein [Spirillospora albida]|uniref:hypothetical protein n=1 Tax=Spirillospora albida TaxID=58123 RepID=UPI0004BEC1F3|nr:hypothetical protein [Spirillospora albida]
MSRAEISAPDTEPVPVEGPARPARTRAAVLAAAGCAGVLAVAGVRLAAEMTRGPTAAERAAATVAEINARYRNWPAGRIFPERLPYTAPHGSAETARRVGIGPGTPCDEAVDGALGASLTSRGCRAALRATYLDQPQGLAVTVAVLAFPDDRSAHAAAAWFSVPRPRPGVRALPFPGSVAARFGDASRQAAAMARRGPYIVAATVGYADGRPALRARHQQADLAELAPQIADGVLRPLSAPAPIRCGTPEWSC